MLNGSGTFDAIAARRAFGDALLERFPFHAFVSKTITLAPRQGNPPPRLWETPAGLINSIGLPNKGLEGFIAGDLPELAELPVPLIVSVMGFSRDELATLVQRVGERDEVALIELNVSCPNVETGLVMGADPAETARAVERVRPLTDLPLIVKLTPNANDPAAVAVAAEQAGADAISLINTLKGMALDPRGAAVAGGYHRWRVRAGRAGDRAGAGQLGRAGGRHPRDRHGRDRVRRPSGRFHVRGGHLRGGRHRELPRSGRRPADRGRARPNGGRLNHLRHHLGARPAPSGGPITFV